MAKKPMPVEKLAASEPVAVKRTNNDDARERKYRAEDALRVLQRADEIRRDKGLMKDTKAFAKSQMKALGKIK